jgi:hypothetical protein
MEYGDYGQDDLTDQDQPREFMGMEIIDIELDDPGMW